jgi:hypothetical protein
MRRRVGTLDETEFAVVAEVDKLTHLIGVELVRIVVYFIAVEMNEEFGKARAKVETKAAGVADVVLSSEFLVERCGVPIVGLLPVRSYLITGDSSRTATKAGDWPALVTLRWS